MINNPYLPNIEDRRAAMEAIMNTGITDKQREEIAHGISTLLANTYTLYLKTHNFHWNVTGPMFQTLHTMFEVQYTELALAVDEIAERIRALGYPAPGSYREFAELSLIEDANGPLSAPEMIQQLVNDQETLVRNARKIVKITSEAGDEVSSDLLIGRMQVHEKTAWMLRALLEA
jgi:starvation-inducible DNA-binding protein